MWTVLGLVAVVAVNSASCRRRCDFALAPASGGVLASVVTMETGCGGPDCPWLVRVDEGQRVNVTLVNFARPHHHDDDDDDQSDVSSEARDCKVRYATAASLFTRDSCTGRYCGGRILALGILSVRLSVCPSWCHDPVPNQVQVR